MKPINYKLENNTATFIYDEEELQSFHKYGKLHGDNGGILTSIDYNSKFLNYDWYGTIENPNTSLNKVGIQHDPYYSGKLETPDEIINPPKSLKPPTESYRLEIIDFSKL